jgi:hypothetical protein
MRGRLRQIAWFVGLWAAGVATLAGMGLAIRTLLQG